MEPIRGMGKIQLLGGSDKIFQVAKFHLAAQLCPPRVCAIVSSGFVESTEQQKDPFKHHTFAITESNGERFKKSIGKVAEAERLDST
jgi:hypothetical protein